MLYAGEGTGLDGCYVSISFIRSLSLTHAPCCSHIPTNNDEGPSYTAGARVYGGVGVRRSTCVAVRHRDRLRKVLGRRVFTGRVDRRRLQDLALVLDASVH